MKDMAKNLETPLAEQDVHVPQDPLSDALQRVLLAHTQAQGRLARSLKAVGTDVDALEHLVAAPLGPGHLAQRLGITPAAATLVVDRLVGRGHALRVPDKDDGRRTLVTLTDEGRGTVLEHAMPMLQRLDTLARTLTPAEAAAVLRYLEGAAEALNALGRG